MSRVHLVRHAEAGRRDLWTLDDKERPLDSAGVAQAEALVETFARERLDRVSSSPYVRCVQTVEPLARARGLPVVADAALAEGADADRLLELAESAGDAVLCTHGDLMTGAVLALRRRGVALDPGDRWQKASIWTLVVDRGAIVAGSYTPPPGG